MPKYSETARNLYPYLLPLFERSFRGNGTGGAGGAPGIGGAPSPHPLSSVHHTGLLADAQAPQFLMVDGSRPLTGDLAVDPGMTIDGVDLSVHVLDPNAHHNRDHLITGSTHTITGSAFDLVGATATNTLGLLTPSSSPGAAAAILRTDSNGGLALDTTLFVVDAASNLVTIDTNLLYADTANNRVGINQTPGNAALDVIVTTNADHTQRLKQKSGQTGRLWRVENAAGDELIVLNSQGDLQSGMPGFVSGLTGWQITHTGNAEFNNIWARGELHATVFVKDEVHATGGTLIVATAGKLYSDAVIDSTTVDELELELVTDGGVADGVLTLETDTGDITLTIEDVFNFIEIDDPPSGPGFYFQMNDIVRSKTEVPTGVTDFWLEIRSEEQLDGFSSYGVIKRSGTDGTLPAGSAVVSYGVPGDGRILLTSDLNFAPYQDVFTVGPEVWTGDAGSIIPHVRLGRLDGVGVTAVSGIEQYGLIAGTDLSNANSPYIVASNLQLRLHKIDLTANDGTNDTVELTATGNLTLGPNIGVDAGKSFQFFSTGADAGDLLLGQLTGSYMQWDASAAALNINGSIFLGGSDANSLEVGEDGNIHSAGKTTYADQDPGFFMGWDTDAHKLNIGAERSYLQWDGVDMLFSTENPLFLYRDTPGVVLQFGNDLSVSEMSFGVTAVSELSYDADFRAVTLIASGTTVRIMTSNTPASATATGITGSIRWDTSHLYICTGTNTWRRIAHSTW